MELIQIQCHALPWCKLPTKLAVATADRPLSDYIVTVDEIFCLDDFKLCQTGTELEKLGFDGSAIIDGVCYAIAWHDDGQNVDLFMYNEE